MGIKSLENEETKLLNGTTALYKKEDDSKKKEDCISYIEENLEIENEDSQKDSLLCGVSKEVVIATVLMIVSVLLYCCSYVSVQYLGGAVPDNELNVFRFSIQVFMTSFFLIDHKESIKSTSANNS